MTYESDNINDYFKLLPVDRVEPMKQLLEVIRSNIPDGFIELLQYKMPSFAVPHSIYPKGYHCNPKEPLPFISVASQKNFISFYHLGIYADNTLLNWFQEEYKNLNIGKLDMGKSCIRFKKPDNLPLKLIGELCTKLRVEDWINLYESKFNVIR